MFDISDRIVALPAATMAGLAVKGQVLNWIYDNRMDVDLEHECGRSIARDLQGFSVLC
jgi:hypothetical protein